MTECTQSCFTFASHFRREVVARFDGGTITSDGGAPLLRETNQRLRLLERFGQCFLDRRDPARIQHTVQEMVAQRVYGLALGYEDLNDHDQLRQDPLLQMMAGKPELETEPLAGKSTLCRMEASAATAGRYKKITYQKEGIDQLLVDVFLEAHAKPAEQIVIDIDATDLALHGKQEGRFFHGYYDHYCYLPLYVFCGEHLLGVRLRQANQDASAGSLEEIQRIVGQIRAAWPEVRVILRGDSGFCRDELMNWCEQNKVDYVFGMARNPRLERIVSEALEQARQQWEATKKPARVFVEFEYETVSGSWSRARRMVAKAEHIDGKSNPRFVVTSLTDPAWQAKPLYEELYCARGDMENRIKEQLTLFAERVSAETMRANQLRLYLSAMAYLLLCGLRRLGLRGTEMASAQVSTIRIRLLKIGAQIRVTVRKIWLSMASAYPWQHIYEAAYTNLRC